MDPSSDAPKDNRSSDPSSSSIFTAISTIFGFSDFVSALNQVSEDNRIFISLIERVRYDVDEAFRLRRCRRVADHFGRFPKERTWIDGTIMDVQRSLNDLGLYVENAKVDLDSRVEVKMKNKFEWVLRNPQKLITRQIALSTCHHSLMVAIQAMHTVEMGISGGAFDENSAALSIPASNRPGSDLVSNDTLLGPYTRRKKSGVDRKDLQVSAQEIEIASENLPGMPSTISMTTTVDANLPKEPVVITPAALPLIAGPRDDDLRPKLSLRGTSGYFPSLPNLQQNQKNRQNRNPYPELPGCPPAIQSLSNLPPTNQSTSPIPEQRSPIKRRPVAPSPKPLPYLPRHQSLRSGLSAWIIPWSDVQTEQIVDAASPTSSNASTITSSPDTVSSMSSTHTTNPDKERSLDQRQPIASGSSTDTTSPDKERRSDQAQPTTNLPSSSTTILDKTKSSDQGRVLSTQERRRLAHTRRLATAYDSDDD
jgi:hypothetical protein